MIRAYRRSRIAACVIVLLSFLVVGLVWYQDRAYPLYIPIIASILTLGLGIVAAKLVGNILANMENTRYLGYLHMELDPKKFIEAYQEIPGRLPKGSYQAAVCSSYLADGYWADGAFSRALETLEGKLPEGNLALEGLYTVKRCACYLAQGDVKQAEQAIRRLDEIVDACRLSKAELAGNLAGSLRIYQNHYRVLTGKFVDVEVLQDSFHHAQYNLRRLEIAKILAQAFLRDGQPQKAEKALAYLRENGGKTFFCIWADDTSRNCES